MKDAPWYSGLSGASFSLVLRDINPIQPFARAFREFKFQSLRLGETPTHLFCALPDIFSQVEAELRGEPYKVFYAGGALSLDMNARTFSIWFSHCWGDSVVESQDILLSCLAAVKTISYWKIESDDTGPTQRVEGTDLDSLRARLGLTQSP